MARIDKTHRLNVSRQCELLNVPRSSFYYSPREDDSYNEELMKQIDKQYMLTPFYGVPRMTEYLCGLSIERPNQVWAMDITYIPLAGSHMYLVAIIDVYSRYIVGWSLPNAMTTRWCRECLEEAIMQHGAPEILNADQGSQFSSSEFSGYFTTHPAIKFSMDGKGRAIDNIFIERFWRSLKYEKIYLEPSDNGLELYHKIKDYMLFYNMERPHQGLEYKRPVEMFRAAA
jgi:putative transposase